MLNLSRSLSVATISLASIGLFAMESRGDAMVNDLGQGVSGLFMNNSGVVAGLRPDPNGLQIGLGQYSGINYSPFLE